ncbi:MAG: regulatory protein RecX [Microbacteriaceae bacterium]|nr:regulatory protein RecX [Microbacteriaceae bacterium]
MRALGRRGMSRRELERLLAAQGYHEHAIADELDRLEGVGLIDDYAFAQHLVAHLQESKGMSGGAIKAELVKRVVAPGAIEYAMDLIDTADELAQARELAVKRARQYGSLDQATVERRLTAFLLRRGFAASTVRAAVVAARTA